MKWIAHPRLAQLDEACASIEVRKNVRPAICQSVNEHAIRGVAGSYPDDLQARIVWRVRGYKVLILRDENLVLR